MKNRLLAAFLTLATAPFFAHNTPTQQPANTELLSHLTQAKSDIETALTELSTLMQKTEETTGQDYQSIRNTTQELYNLITKNITPNMDQIFDALCDQMKPLQEIAFADNSINVFEQLFQDNFIENHTEEIEAILTKYDNNALQSQKTDVENLEQRITNYFFSSPNNMMIALMVTAQETCNSLLQKINVKITELMVQL